jgi:polysaccharide biosynthesis protein PslH
MTSRAVHIIDPSLKSDAGHHFRFTQEIGNFYRNNGFAVNVYGKRNYQGSFSDINRVFKKSIYDDHAPLWRRLLGKARKSIKAAPSAIRVFARLAGVEVGRFLVRGERVAAKRGKVLTRRLIKKSTGLGRVGFWLARIAFLILSPILLLIGLLVAIPWRIFAFLRRPPSAAWPMSRNYGIARVFSEKNVKAGDLMIFHTATLDLLYEFMQWSGLCGVPVTAVFLFHFDLKEYSQIEPKHMGNAKRWAAQLPHASIKLAGMTGSICNLYSRVLGLKVDWIPELGPPPLEAKAPLSSAIEAELEGNRFAFLPGALRADKNIAAIETLLDALSATFRSANGKLALQLKPDAKDLRQALTAMHSDWVLILPEVLSDEDFYGLIVRSHFLLCPYESSSYRLKRSGAYTEASHFQKAIIFPAGSSMKFDRYRNAKVFEWQQLEEIPFLCRKCFSNSDGGNWLVPTVPAVPNLFKQVTDITVTNSNRKFAFIFRADWIRCGSNNTMLWQERTLVSAGYTVVNIFLTDHVPWESLRDRSKYLRLHSQSEALYYFGATAWMGWRFVGSLVREFLSNGISPMQYWFAMHKSMSLPSGLHKLGAVSSKNSESIIVANHYFTVGLAKRFANKHGIQRVYCDSHDLWSKTVKIAFRGFFRFFPSSFKSRFDYETKIYRSVEKVSCVNSNESLALSKAGVATTLIGAPGLLRSRGVRRFGETTSLRFVVFASDNPSNRESYEWLLTNVILRLKPEVQKLLVVAGGISGYLELLYAEKMPEVVFAGSIEDPSSVYNRAHVFLVPVLSGTGVSIRTLEAISSGVVPLVTTHALRSLDLRQFPSDLICDTAMQWQRAINRLANNSTHLATMQGQIAKMPLRLINSQWQQKFLRFLDIVA